MRSEFLTPEFTADGEEAVEGIYPLGALLGRSAGGVVYETTFGEGEGARPAAIKIARGDLEESGEILERWRHAMTLSHANLLRIYAAGVSVVNDAPIVYVVMERAEASLAAVLARRRLTEEETRATIEPALAALDYLHGKGYAHGRIKPSNVMAVGDTVKLSSDSIAPGDDRARAEDVYAAGRLIQDSMAPGIGGVLAEIAGHALDPDPARRWTVRQMQARLRPPEVARPPEVVRMAEVRRDTEDPDVPRRGIPGWIFAGLAAVVLVVGGLAWMRSREPATREPVAAVTTSARPAAPPAVAPAPVRPRSGIPPRRASGWSVIVAAYGTRAPAEKRLRSMESKWARFQWSVVEQRADKTYYLVVIGHNLAEDAAEALRKRAVEAGLPRDTYIKRVS